MARRISITRSKAKEMLENPPHGQPLSKKQRGLFGLIASGKRPTRTSTRRRR